MGCLNTINEVIRKEFELIQKRRERKPCPHPYYDKDDGPPVEPKKGASCTAPGRKRCDTLIGLALSGGGIRSAATNLGVLQGLSERDILPMVDYLSTVSGGGYIGACLSSLLSNRYREPQGTQEMIAPYTFDNGAQPLFATDWGRCPFREDKYKAEDDHKNGKIQMDHIRIRASYLATRARHFSPTVMRTVGSVFTSIIMSLLWFALVITVLTSAYMAIVSYVAPGMKIKPGNAAVAEQGTMADSYGAFWFSYAAWGTGEKSANKGASQNSLTDDLTTITRYAWKPFKKFLEIPKTRRWKIGLSILGLGAVILLVTTPMLCACSALKKNYALCFGIYLAALLFVLGVSKWVFGVSSAFATDADAFTGGAILIVPPLFAGGALFGVWLTYVLTARFDKGWGLACRSQVHQLTGILVIGLLCTLVWAVLPGFMNIGTGTFKILFIAVVGTGLRYAVKDKNGKTVKKTKSFTLPPKYKEWLLGLCTLIFVFLAVVYAGNIIRDTWLDGNWPANATGFASVSQLLRVFGVSLVLLFVAFPLLVDANKISPHYFYRDRLAEAFLQTKISEHSYLRNDTEMKLTDLHGHEKQKCAARGPYLLMNATLNLTASQDLKAFNRKSDIFTFSRLFVGSNRIGYIQTDTYGVDGGTLKLARAMAISGAAVTSVMGMNSSLARSFACTILGVRLGYWLPNFKYFHDREDKELTEKCDKPTEIESAPNGALNQELNRKDQEEFARRPGQKAEEPIARTDMGKRCYFCNWTRLFKELVGHTTATEKEIYLSDGGHSGDNLGIIPLLQRRVKLLLVSDSECDPDHIFNSFNSSVRNAYVDEGIQIKINLGGLRKDGNGLTSDKFAVGRIYYPDQDNKQENWLVVFKNTLTGDEIAPIVNYKGKSPDFPHESTGDQFFTEEQFEAYRALGRFAVFDILKTQSTWLAACRKSAKIPEVNCEAAHDFLTGRYVHPGMGEKSAMRFMQE